VTASDRGPGTATAGRRGEGDPAVACAATQLTCARVGGGHAGAPEPADRYAGYGVDRGVQV